MAQYIDKSALVAEIERILNETNYEPFTDEVLGRRIVCGNIKDFIDTLEVREVQEEPVSENLEKAASEYAIIFRPKKGEPIINEPTKESFIAGAQWQKERIINKAYKWLKKNATYVHPRKGVETCMVNLTAFKETLEE